MNTAQAAEAARSNTDSFEVWQFDTTVVAHHYVFDATFAIYQNTDLPPGFERQLCQLSCKLSGDHLMWRNSPRVELFYPSQLIRFQTQRISQYVTNELPSLIARLDYSLEEL
jgi:hypothetical protein